MKKIFVALLSMLIAMNISVYKTEVFAQEKDLSGEIRVSSFDSMRYKNFLEYAAKSFEEKFPDTTVIIESFSAMPEVRTVTSEGEDGQMMVMTVIEHVPDPQAQQDYITRANTEMISGGGADIYAIDVLPYYKYADNGQFEDLRKFMDNDPQFELSDYYSNIFDAAMYNNGQYILPMDYIFDLLSYNTTLMDSEAAENFSFGKYTYEQLADLGYESFISRLDPDSENPIKLFNMYADAGIFGTFFGNLLEANYRSFVDIDNKKANFNDGRFANMLEMAKEYQEQGYLNTPINYEDMMKSGSITAIGGLGFTQKYLYKTTNHLMLLQSLIPKSMIIGMYTTTSGEHGITDDDELIGLLANDNGDSMFTTSQSYAVNANSDNKELAWEFLKHLLSDEMQGSTALTYNPVNKNAAAQKAKHRLIGEIFEVSAVEMEENPEVENDDSEAVANEAAMQSESNDSDSESDEFSFDYSRIAVMSYFDIGDVTLTDDRQEVFDIYMDYLDRYTEMLNLLLIRDNIIDEMISSETKNFFEGTRTAQEVARSIQSKVDMYLQE